MAEITGTPGNDSLVGTSADDNIHGNGGNDTLIGGGGNDYFHGDAGDDSIVGGAGLNDWAFYDIATAAGINANLATGIVTGGAGNDTLTGIEHLAGSILNDTITGSAGNNVLQGRAGNDLLTGGGGRDTVDYYHATGGVTVNLFTNSASGADGNDSLSGFTDVTGSFFADSITGDNANNFVEAGGGNDTVLGGLGNDYIKGNSGNDSLSGGDGDDGFAASSGNDFMDGGAGSFDNVNYGDTGFDLAGAGTQGVVVNLLTGTATDNWGGSDTLVNIENVQGSPLADTITGNTLRNNLQGNAGNDTIFGGDNDDYIVGGLGIDSLDGGNGLGDAVSFEGVPGGVNVNLATGVASNNGEGQAETVINFENVHGSYFNDIIQLGAMGGQVFARAGNDSITGGIGNDNFHGGSGNDTLSGGAGFDTANYSVTNFDGGVDGLLAVTVNLTTGTATDNWGNTDTLVSIENVQGSALADSITGDNANNFIDAQGGNDTVFGGLGNDYIKGNAGNDSLMGGDGDDNFAASSGNDFMDGGAGSFDNVSYNDASFDLAGAGTLGVVVNLLTGIATDNWGNADTLVSIENVQGSALADSITGDNANNFIDAQGGNDTVFGGLGNDYIKGNAGNDSLMGGDGDDGFVASSGNDFMDGGAGSFDNVNYNDTGFDLAGAPIQGVVVNLLTGTATDNWGGSDTLVNIENVQGSALADTITGNTLDNNLQGNAGNDTIFGGDGTDFIVGGLGIDSLDGGAGSDAVSFEGVPAGVNVNLATGVASNNGEGQVETIVNFENAHGSLVGDIIQLSATSGYVFGRSGNDSITGGIGNDNFYGGSGNDTLNGGAGSDRASYFDDGFDGGGPGILGITVNLATGIATDNWGNTDTLISIENVSGSALADTISGDAANNGLSGEAGADSILGLGGNDFITGGAGNDTLDGGVVTDLINYLDLNTVSYSGATAAVTINMSGITGTGSTGSGTATGDASVGTDTLSNFNFIQGSAFNDTITGSAANWFEEINAGAGDDVLNGGVIAGNASNRVTYSGTAVAGVVVDLIAGTAVGQAGSNAGSDTLVNFNFVTGSNFADTLLGSNRTDFGETFEGRDGNDSIDGKGGFDTIRFGSASGGVTVSLVAGTSSGAGVGSDIFANIEGVRGSNFNDIITGDGFNNNLDGQGGDDSILGGAGSDSLIGLGGNDTMDGGLILDRVNYSDLNLTFYNGASAGVNINLTGITGDGSVGSGVVTGDASVGTDVIKNINYIGGSNFNDTITGSSAIIFEIFEPGAGNDTIDGGAITDTLNSDNSNRVTYQSIAGAGVTVDFIAGTAVGAAGSNAGNDTLANFTQAQGSSFADTLLGTNRSDIFETFEGRDGNDSIDGRGGFDLVRFDSATGGLVVNLVTGTASGTGVGSDVFVNIEGVVGSGSNDSITGGNTANALMEFFQGNAGNDTIDGGQGYDVVYFGRATTGAVVVLNDTLDGSASDGQGGTDVLRNIEGVLGSAFNDSMTGSNTAAFESFEGRIGNDTINGLGGTDRVEYFYSRAGVNVNLVTGVATDGEGTTDTLSNIEDIRGSRDFNDTITGSSQQNRFEGLGGNDTMSGAGGRDTSIYAGTAASATRTHNPDGSWTIVTATEGTDTLRNVETLQFSDRKVVIEDPQTDFNADGNSDLLWFRQTDGYAYLWTMTNNVQSGGNAIGQIGAAWTIQTTGDFNGDGSSDFVWKNTTTGQFYLWNFTNGIQSSGYNIGVIGTNWNVMGSGDFNADGSGDIVWRDSNTGQLYLWMMQNNAIASSTNLGAIGVDWTVQAVGDFNGDGTSDLALRNTATGQAYLWNFSNGALSGGNNLGNIPTNWTIMGSGDFNADGTDDLAWRNGSNGNLNLWMMQNNSISSTSDLGTIGAQWTIDAISDVNADGTSDLLLKNSTSGQFYIWDINNGVVSGGADLGLIGADWQLV